MNLFLKLKKREIKIILFTKLLKKLKKFLCRFTCPSILPWSEGYSDKRNSIIETIVDKISITRFDFTKNIPQSYGYGIDERCIEIPWVFSKIRHKSKNILDAGCAFFEFGCIRNSINNTNCYLLALNKQDMFLNVKEKKYYRICGDLRNLPFKDNFFECITCISTIEHVGLDNTKLYSTSNTFKENKINDYLVAFKNLAMVLKPSGDLFITLPFGKWKTHGWLQVFNEKMIDLLISATTLKLVEESIFIHKKSGWILSDRKQAANAIYYDIHKDKNRKSSLAAAEAVCCLWFHKQ